MRPPEADDLQTPIDLMAEVGRDNAVAQAVYRHVGFEAVDHQPMALPLAGPAHVV